MGDEMRDEVQISLGSEWVEPQARHLMQRREVD